MLVNFVFKIFFSNVGLFVFEFLEGRGVVSRPNEGTWVTAKMREVYPYRYKKSGFFFCDGCGEWV